MSAGFSPAGSPKESGRWRFAARKIHPDAGWALPRRSGAAVLQKQGVPARDQLPERSDRHGASHGAGRTRNLAHS